MAGDKENQGCAAWLIAGVVTCAVAYVPSSGPVLATAFWLREATGWNGFYAVMVVYVPLLALPRDNVIHAYIEWWVRLFGTVGPG